MPAATAVGEPAEAYDDFLRWVPDGDVGLGADRYRALARQMLKNRGGMLA